MNLSALDWELEEMFGVWNNVVQATEDLIQVTRTHRAIIILDKVYKAFFHCEDFINWAYKLHLTHTFVLVLEIEFKRGLYQHDESYDADANTIHPSPWRELFTFMESQQQLKLPLTTWIPRNLKCIPSHLPQRGGQQNTNFSKWPQIFELKWCTPTCSGPWWQLIWVFIAAKKQKNPKIIPPVLLKYQ